MRKEIKISLMRQQGDELFAFADSPLKENDNRSKIIGSGHLKSFTEFHDELFNIALSTFKGQDVSFVVNGEHYANSTEQGIEVNPDLSKSFLDEFTDKNTINFEMEETLIGLYKLKVKDDVNLYKMEDETCIRDRNGYTEHTSKEDAMSALNFYFKEDEKRNTYTIREKDFTKVSIDGEIVDEFRNKKSTMHPEEKNELDGNVRRSSFKQKH